MLQYEIQFPLLSNKTTQQNSQHCINFYNELHHEVYNVLHNKVSKKFFFFCVSVCFPLLNIQGISREIPLSW